jgi:hypothetical protein
VVAASAVALVGAAAVAVQVTAGSNTDRTSDVATTPTDPASPEDVAAHVAEPPAWFGEPVGGHRDGALRTGRWVSTAIGKVDGDDAGDDGVTGIDDPSSSPSSTVAMHRSQGRRRSRSTGRHTA